MNDLNQFNMTNQLIMIENMYNNVSHNRFRNKFNYQKKVQNIARFAGGYNKIMALLNRFNVENS